MRCLVAATLPALASLALLALLPGGRPTTAADTPAASAIAIENGQFVPSILTVPVGAAVTWTNRDWAAHRVISDDGLFDSGPLKTGQTFSWLFDTPGTFTYHSHRPGMSGSIVVQAPNADLPAPIADPPTEPAEPSPSLDGPGRNGGDPPPSAPAPHIATVKAEPNVVQAQSEPASLEEAPVAQSSHASHGTVTVDVGNTWFCGPAYQGADPSVFCETTIHVGDTVRWVRVAGTHNVAECGTNWSKWDGSECVGAAWRSPTLTSTSPEWSRTFTTAGTFYYLCELHGLIQKGRLLVQAAAATPTPSPGATATPSPTPTAAGAAAVPQGGSAPGPAGSGGPLATTFFAAAAVAFLAGILAFRRRYRM